MNFPSFEPLVQHNDLAADAGKESAAKRRAKRWCMAAVGALLMSGWAAHAQLGNGSAPIAARTLPTASTPAQRPAPLLRCPDGSPRICTPHGCYCT